MRARVCSRSCASSSVIAIITFTSHIERPTWPKGRSANKKGLAISPWKTPAFAFAFISKDERQALAVPPWLTPSRNAAENAMPRERYPLVSPDNGGEPSCPTSFVSRDDPASVFRRAARKGIARRIAWGLSADEPHLWKLRRTCAVFVIACGREYSARIARHGENPQRRMRGRVRQGTSGAVAERPGKRKSAIAAGSNIPPCRRTEANIKGDSPTRKAAETGTCYHGLLSDCSGRSPFHVRCALMRFCCPAGE